VGEGFFLYWLTLAVLDKGPLNGCLSVCVCNEPQGFLNTFHTGQMIYAKTKLWSSELITLALCRQVQQMGFLLVSTFPALVTRSQSHPIATRQQQLTFNSQSQTKYFVIWPTMSCFADWSKRMINVSQSTVCHYNDKRSRDHISLSLTTNGNWVCVHF